MFVIQDLLVDKSFLELDRQLNAFNIFDVLNLREYEIRHTRYLSHMLDPAGTHGLGSAFLRNFLLQASAQLATDERVGLLDEVHKLDLDLARVTAEISLPDKKDQPATSGDAPRSGKPKAAATSGRLDILLQIPRRGGKDIAIAIENKINARESNGQLGRYKDWVQAHFDDAVLLYLTVNDEEVMPDWKSITYSNVVYPALALTSGSCATLGPGPALMIAHYMAVLRDKVEAEAANADADRLAQELHRNHPAAKHAIKTLQDAWQRPIDGRALDSNWALYSRYKVAFDFLSGYETDELSKALQWFGTEWPRQVAAMPGAPRIVIDDSNRACMRFLPVPDGSRLEALSRQYAQRNRADRKYAWTKGQHGALFEIRCYPLRPQDDAQDAPQAYGWNLFLVVGPLEDIDRTAFVTRLRALLGEAFPERPNARQDDFHPVIRQGKISPIFLSALKWKLEARNVEALQRELLSPRLMASLVRVARLLEQAWAAPGSAA